jgi:Reverse transcriptase (RNA-dependent DNA polymerase)/gag-polypeptide of LTR copia-type/GAG-pre-integrase domain
MALITPTAFSHQLPLKLTNDNYLSWKFLVLPLVKGHDLLNFLDGTSPPPPDTILTSAGVAIPNPDFLTWMRQDQLLLAWLLSSISETVVSQVIHCTTSSDLWHELTVRFSSQSLASVMDLKMQIHSLQKGHLSMQAYLDQKRSLADRLRMIGCPVSDADLQLFILHGLSIEYDSLVVSLNSRSDAVSFNELCGLLLAHEQRLLKHALSIAPLQPSSPAFPASLASATSQQPVLSQAFLAAPASSVLGSPSTDKDLMEQFSAFLSSRGSWSGKHSGKSSSGTSADRFLCQLCMKRGHTADRCYKRFDATYKPPPPRPLFKNKSFQPQALSVQSGSAPPAAWYMDSGASTHVTSDLNALTSYSPYTGSDQLHIGDGKGLDILHIGSGCLQTSSSTLVLSNILHVPSISKPLLSISQLLADNNVYVQFHANLCLVKECTSHKVILQGIKRDGLYLISAAPQALLCQQDSSQLWHLRLGHASSSSLQPIATTLSCKPHKLPLCTACSLAKAHRLPFYPSDTVAHNPLELVHCDVWGPSPIVSHNGYRYYVLFTDQYTRYNWIYFCIQKSEVAQIFAQFKALVENTLSCTIKTMQIDGGTEFLPIQRSYPSIQFRISCPYTPQQNGLVERRHRQVVELSLASMFHAHLPQSFWSEIFESIVFIINRIPSSSIQSQSPYSLLHHKDPDYSFFKVLGCQCFPFTRPYTSHKLAPRSIPCVFLGYSSTYKGYKCLNLSTNKIIISRHVLFNEDVFPFKYHLPVPSSDLPSSVPTQLVVYSPSQSSSISQTNTLSQNPPPITHVYQRRNHNSHSALPQTPVPITQPASVPPSQSVSVPTPVHPMLTRSRTKTIPKALLASNNPISPLDLDPTTYSQASKDPKWRDAMATELDALAKNQTWTLVPHTEASNVVGCKWVFKTKRRSDGSVERYKARLVAKGYTQEEGLDYTETFSPVVKPTTIRLVLSLAVTHNWCIRQLDINNAFLHGDLEETIFMSQPPGFHDQQFPSHVCRLHKALYGLKQSPRAWYQKLRTTLLAFGFCTSCSDPSLFVYRHDNHTMYLLVYVDDIVLTGNNTSLITQIVHLLDQKFTIKDLGKLHFFLGIEVHPHDNGLLLTQSRYIYSILDRTHMHGAKPVNTPMATGLPLTKLSGAPFEDPHLYRSVVGALQYATITRPEISFAVNRVSQFMHSPSTCHWVAVKRILRYLKGTINYGLTIMPSTSLTLHAYADSDWAGCPDDRKSTTGYLVFLGQNLISWTSKKQTTVARSTTEAEYRGLAMVTAEVVWLQSVFRELGIQTSIPILWCDNLGATFLASNPAFHARTKHIELDFHFIREKVAAGSVKVKFICSQDQVADALTKPLSTTRFQTLRSKLTVTCPTLRLRGRVSDDIAQDDNAEQGHEDTRVQRIGTV